MPYNLLQILDTSLQPAVCVWVCVGVCGRVCTCVRTCVCVCVCVGDSANVTHELCVRLHANVCMVWVIVFVRPIIGMMTHNGRAVSNSGHTS